MALRTCMEILRDNQLNNANRIVPYRDYKLTHLFKNYFDGEGKVRMVVCLSPLAEDYDETIHVMRFAEVAQEVVVDRPSEVKIDVGLAPGRRRANLLYKAALQEAGDMEEEPSVNAPHPYQVALGIVCLQKFLSEGCSVNSLSELKKLLDKRSRVREGLVDDLKKRQGDFRTQLVAQEEELLELHSMSHNYHSVKNSHDRAQREVQRLRAVFNTQERQVTQLKAEVDSLRQTISMQTKDHTRLKNTLARVVTEQKKDILRTQVMYEHDKKELEQELTAIQKETEKEAAEKLLLKKKMKGFVSHEKDKFDRLSKQMQRKQKEIHAKNERLRQVEEFIKNSPLPACSGESVLTPLRETRLPNTDNAPVLTRGGRKRSLSENWLEHKPVNTVDNGDLLQPIMKKKRTVTNPKPKDLTSRQLDKYCLKHQEQDAKGGVHTELYKGDIMHTRGGGVAVQFTDIEKLNHDSPTKTVTRSLSQQKMDQDEYSSFSLLDGEDQEEDEWTDVETRCAVGIEGRPGNPPAFSHISTKK